MELGLSTYSIAQHVKCDLARPWVRGALKKNLKIQTLKPDISLFKILLILFTKVGCTRIN